MNNKEKILVVDDTIPILEMIQINLELEGYSVVTATRGKEVLKKIEEDFFNLALLDIMLPDIDGLELLRIIKEKYPDTVVIIITGYASLDSSITALTEGAFSYIVKPFDITELITTVQRGLEKQRLSLENRRLLQEMAELNRQLEEKVKLRTVELEKLNNKLRENLLELKRLDKMKNEFLRMVTHDLKAPLTGIIGYCSTLSYKIKEMNEEEIKEYLEHILEQSYRMYELIEDILSEASIKAGKLILNTHMTDLTNLVKSCFKEMKILAENKQIEYTLKLEENLPIAYLDEGKIKQVLINLLDNAIKFTPPKGKIEVKAYLGRDKTIWISVSDSGPGIPENKVEEIFRKRVRILPADQIPRPGTGMGLAFSQMIVNLHGGKIWVESKVNQGSKFLVSLPVIT